MASRKKLETVKEEPRRYRWPGLYRTAPARTRCACRAEVDTCYREGFPLTLDPWDLSQFGEVQALLLKIPTFHVIGDQVYRRTACAITRAPVPYVGEVRREHRCGMFPPSADATRVRSNPIPEACPPF